MTIALAYVMLTDAISLAMESGSHLDLPTSAGVYIIINASTNALYVGQSVNIRQRASMHMWRLRAGEHENRLLAKDAETYGAEVFRFAVVCLSDVERLPSLEREVIAQAKAFDCYNLMGLDATQTPAQRQAARKLRELARGRVRWARWVHRDDVPALAEYADELQRRREEMKPAA